MYKNPTTTIPWYAWIYLWMFPTYTNKVADVDGGITEWKIKQVGGAIYILSEKKTGEKAF